MSQLPDTEILPAAMLRLPSHQRHSLRNAIVALRNGLAVLGDGGGSPGEASLSPEEQTAIVAELRQSVAMIERALLGPFSPS